MQKNCNKIDNVMGGGCFASAFYPICVTMDTE